MKTNEFIKQFNIWLLMEFILDDIEHNKLAGDCQVKHLVSYITNPMGPDPFIDNSDYERQIEALDELKLTEVINYHDTSDGFVIGTAEMTLDVKREAFDRTYKRYSKIFYILDAEEHAAISSLAKDDLKTYKKFLEVVKFHLRHADGLRNNQCRFTLSIPFSDFGDMTRPEIFQLAEKIKDSFNIYILPKTLSRDYLVLGVYSKTKVDELSKAIERALKKAGDEVGKKNISKIVIVDSGSKSYKLAVNGDYKNCLEPSQGRKYWELFLQTAQNIPLEKENHKGYFDYINSNKNNLFIKAGYGKSKLLKVNNGYILPNVPMEIIGEKAFKSRLNKMK